jgi:aminoglycoside phosphotransferase (APT) family kinase protein
MAALPAGGAEVAAQLALALQEHFGELRGIDSLSIRSNPYRSSFAIHDVDLVFDDGSSLELLIKNLSWHALRRSAAASRPSFLHDPLREIETYRRILTPHAPGTAVFFGAVEDPAQGRFWLLLERVEAPQLADVGEFAVWEEAARLLASMHSRFSTVLPDLQPAATNRLLRYDAGFYRLWAQRTAAFLRMWPVEGRIRTGLEHLVTRYDRVVEQLLDLPKTVVHGEFYSFNVLAGPHAGGRICPVDWETAALGPGLVDLAGLVAGSWTTEQKLRLAGVYHEVLGQGGAPSENFLRALDWCRLHVAVQWTGWSAQATRHARWHEWATEAVSLAEALDI